MNDDQTTLPVHDLHTLNDHGHEDQTERRVLISTHKWWMRDGDHTSFHLFSNMMTGCLTILESQPEPFEMFEMIKVVDADFDTPMKRECRVEYAYLYGNGLWDVSSPHVQTGYVDMVKAYVAKFTRMYLTKDMSNTKIIRHVCTLHDTFLKHERYWPDDDLDLLHTIMTNHMKTRPEYTSRA